MTYIAAIDQGTTSSRCIIFNSLGEIVASAQKEHNQIFPQPGWVEHDAVEILENCIFTFDTSLASRGIKAHEISAIGITNQRETSLLWNRRTGRPYGNAIVWQDTRTDEICNSLKQSGMEPIFQKKTGLPVATYFSSPKIRWLLERHPEIEKDLMANEVLFGNIDTWLIWNLTGSVDCGLHITDPTNASRTMLMNLKTLSWDDELLDILKIPLGILPAIRSSSEIYGHYEKDGTRIPVAGDLGDQQAALFGQGCFEPGMVKNTYGTGCFMLLNTGNEIIPSKNGLLTTVGYQIGEKKTCLLP